MAVSRVAIQAATSQLSAGLILADANGLLASAEPRFKIISATHDISVTGDQAITGAGFAPKGYIIFATIHNQNSGSVGFVDQGNAGLCLRLGLNDVAGLLSFSTTNVIDFFTAVNNEASAQPKTLDADGATITWAKIGTPTGTITLLIMFFR